MRIPWAAWSALAESVQLQPLTADWDTTPQGADAPQHEPATSTKDDVQVPATPPSDDGEQDPSR